MAYYKPGSRRANVRAEELCETITKADESFRLANFLAQELDRFSAEAEPLPPYAKENPQSNVLVTSCIDCPFATGPGDGRKPACLLESPIFGPGPGAVELSFCSCARPRHCPLMLGPVVVRVARGRV
jgi:hypothetical protein